MLSGRQVLSQALRGHFSRCSCPLHARRSSRRLPAPALRPLGFARWSPHLDRDDLLALPWCPSSRSTASRPPRATTSIRWRSVKAFQDVPGRILPCFAGRSYTPWPAGQAEGATVVGGFDVHFHPAAPGEAAMWTHARVGQGPDLIVAREAQPEIVILLAHGKAREEIVADEVAPAPEHRRDPHVGPLADGLVQLLGRAGAAARQHPAGLSPLAHAAKTAAAIGQGHTCS